MQHKIKHLATLAIVLFSLSLIEKKLNDKIKNACEEGNPSQGNITVL